MAALYMENGAGSGDLIGEFGGDERHEDGIGGHRTFGGLWSE